MDSKIDLIKKIDGKTLKNSYFNTNESPKVISGIMMITTPTCVKCKAILANEERLRETLPVGMFVYEFNGDEDGLSVLQDMGVATAPVMLYLGLKGEKAFKPITTMSDLAEFVNGLDSMFPD